MKAQNRGNSPPYSSTYSPLFFNCLSFRAALPLLLVLVHGPHELLLVVPLLPSHVVTTGDHLVSHHLKTIQNLENQDIIENTAEDSITLA